MKAQFERSDLLDSIQTVIGVTGGRNTLPILSNILIRVADGEIRMSATDLETSIMTGVTGTIETDGEITLPAKKLFEIIRSLPDSAVTLHLSENDRVTISCANSHHKLAGLPAEDFPEAPKMGEDFIEVKPEFLCRTIEDTDFSASTDEVRYFLNGLYFNFTPEITEVVATDGRRLALVIINEGLVKDKNINVILPLKAVKEISKVFALSTTDIRVNVSDGQIVFTDGEVTLASRLVEGEYPAYRNIIPESHTIEVVFDKTELMDSLRRVSVMANPRTCQIAMSISSDDNLVTISSKSPEIGEANDVINCEADGTLDIGFDSRFMVEAVNSIRADSVKMKMKDSLSAITITAEDTEDHLCLVMPMRLE